MRRIVLALLASSALCSLARAQVFDTSPSGGGTAGVGIASAAINGSGHLIFTRTDGTTLDAGVPPTSGAAVASAAINGSNHLIFTKTDNTTIDAGALPAAGAAVTSATINGSNHLIFTKSDASTIDAGVLPSGGGATIGTTAGFARDAAASITAEQALAIALGRAFDDPANSGHVRTPGGSYPIVYLDPGQGGPGYPSAAYPACPADNLPTGWPAGDASNFTNRASWFFGSTYALAAAPSSCPNSQITSRTIMDQHFEHNQINGNANTNIDGNAKEANLGVIYNRFRSYPEGDPHDTTVIASDGLHLKMFCNGDPLGTHCDGDANTYGGIIRPEIGINDGDFVEVCGRRPDVPWGWGTTWLYRGKYPDPQSGLPPFYGANGSTYPRKPHGDSSGNNRHPDEIDFPDGLTRNGTYAAGRSATHDLYSVMPSPFYADLNLAPIFATNSGGFTAEGVFGQGYAAQPFQYLFQTTTDLSQDHCYQVRIQHATWTDPTRSTVATHGSVTYYLDAVQYQKTQADIGHDYDADYAGNLTGDPYTPFSLMVASQIPAFYPNATAKMTYDKVAAADFVVKSIRVLHYTGAGDGVTPLLTNIAAALPGTLPAHYLDVGSTGFGIATASVSFAPITGINQISINVGTLPAGEVFLAYGYNSTTGFGPIFHRKANGDLCLDVASQGNYGDTCVSGSPNNGWLTARWSAGTYTAASPAPEVGSQASGANMISFYRGAPGSLILLGSKSDGYTIASENPSTNVWIGSKSGIDNANPVGTYFLGAQMFNNGTKIVDVDFTAAASGATSVAGTTGGPFSLSGGASIH